MIEAVAEAAAQSRRAGVAEARISRGSAEYRRAVWALFAAGFTTFAMLYCVQPLMPVFSRSFAIGAAMSSLAVSATTSMLAISMPLVGAVSETFGRKGPMTASLFLAAACCLASALAPSWGGVLAARTLEGLALASVPAVAIAYLSEEIEPRDLGGAIGLYVSGSAIGGMLGRLLTGLVMDLSGSWRVAVAAMALSGLAAAVAFVRLLPPSRRFVKVQGVDLGRLAAALRRHLSDPVIRLLCLEGLLLMGGFVTIFNYLSYRLAAPPYRLSQSSVGAIFLVYLICMPVPPWLGRLGGRIGPAPVLCAAILLMLAGTAVTLAGSLIAILAGLTLLSSGFFGAHTIVSGWVGMRAESAKAQASSLYLLAYYVGSSAAGSLGGRVWEAFAWPGIVAYVALLVGTALAVALKLWRQSA